HHALEDVRQAADVVLVSMGEEDGFELFAIRLDVGDVRDDEVDAEHILFREHEPGINGDHVVATFQEHHVLADLTETAEGNYTKGLVVCHLEQLTLSCLRNGRRGDHWLRLPGCLFAPGEIQVLGNAPEVILYGRSKRSLVQRRGRVIHRDYPHVAHLAPLAVDLADG